MKKKKGLEFVIKELDKMIKTGFDCATHGELLKLERRIGIIEKKLGKLGKSGK